MRLNLPFPNNFHGAVRLYRKKDKYRFLYYSEKTGLFFASIWRIDYAILIHSKL